MFDFVPWGYPGDRDTEIRGVPKGRASFLYDEKRAGDVDADAGIDIDVYWQRLCDAQREGYRWLQTDVLAVRKDLLDDDTRDGIRRMAEICEHQDVDCLLRDMEAAVHSDVGEINNNNNDKIDGNKDEL